MTDRKFKYWLTLEDGKTVRFADLAHLITMAVHASDAEHLSNGVPHVTQEKELEKAAQDSLLMVRDPADLSRLKLPLQGNDLRSAVLNPYPDLEPFLNSRGIELRITPHGNGPEYWTLENAAAAMQEQLNWHDATRAEFQDELQDAAATGALVVLNPRTCLPYIPETVRTYWEYVTPDSVNKWLAALNAPYRWAVQPNTPQPQPKQESANEWVSEAQSRAYEIIKEQRARDLYPDQLGIADQIAREFRAAGKVGADGKPISGAYIKRHALKGITSAIVKQLSTAKR